MSDAPDRIFVSDLKTWHGINKYICKEHPDSVCSIEYILKAVADKQRRDMVQPILAIHKRYGYIKPKYDGDNLIITRLLNAMAETLKLAEGGK